MSFRIKGLSPEPYRALYGLSDEALAAQGVRRYIADAKPGFPDRVELTDVEPGQPVLLLNHRHQPAETPYQASHAIFVREGAQAAFDRVDETPQVLPLRTLSLRAFDLDHMMVDADLIDGRQIEALITRLLANPAVAYIQAHYAKRGCYAARIERAFPPA